MSFRIENTIGNSFIVSQTDGTVAAIVRLYGNVHDQKVFSEKSDFLAVAKATNWIMQMHKADSGRSDFSFIEVDPH